VVAGSAGGLKLDVPKTDLRPTMDLVRGAIFSSLGEFIIGAQVLDLFAGTGALGIEALSRGAASATFVESDRQAVATIEKNFARTRLSGTVHALDIFSYLDRLAGTAAFDVIFADPPYAKRAGERDFTSELLASESLRQALKPDGCFILEHLPDAKLPLGAIWECTRERRYGATGVALLRKKE
jgi:16S rRNA (guanine966-N2)-methyltransferase